MQTIYTNIQRALVFAYSPIGDAPRNHLRPFKLFYKQLSHFSSRGTRMDQIKTEDIRGDGRMMQHFLSL